MTFEYTCYFVNSKGKHTKSLHQMATFSCAIFVYTNCVYCCTICRLSKKSKNDSHHCLRATHLLASTQKITWNRWNMQFRGTVDWIESFNVLKYGRKRLFVIHRRFDLTSTHLHWEWNVSNGLSILRCRFVRVHSSNDGDPILSDKKNI